MKELYTALAKAQGQIEAAVKDKINPAFRSKYADLSAVWEACRKVLSANGLAVLQFPLHSEDDKLHLETIITHSSGESISKVFSIPVGNKKDAHAYGSAITYARRFSLAAAIGVVADEDDDGNKAAQGGTVATSKPSQTTAAMINERSRSATAAATTELPEETKHRLDALLSKVRDWCAAESYEDAYLELENANLDSDEKTYLWNFLGSKERNAITAASKKIRAENQAAFSNPLNA